MIILGALFKANVEELTVGNTGIPQNPSAVGDACFAAGAIYIAFFVFCFWQVRLFSVF